MQPKDCILDMYGAFGRASGGWLAIGDLIELLSAFEFDAQAVRAATSRMKRNGLLEAVRSDGVAGYALTPAAAEILADGDRRIFRPLDGDDDSSWIVVTFSVPEQERRKRYLIKARLARLGFGQGPANTWFAPAVNQIDAEHVLRRAGLSDYVAMWRGDYAGFGELTDLVASAWDLDTIAARYRAYVDAQAAPVADLTQRQAFVRYVTSLDDWRPLPFLDPGLPASVTPLDWPAHAARSRFLELEAQLRPAAQHFFDTVTNTPV